MKPISSYTADFFAREIEQGDLAGAYLDTCTGLLLRWAGALRGFYAEGTGLVVRAGYIRDYVDAGSDRFMPVTEKGNGVYGDAPREPTTTMKTGSLFAPGPHESGIDLQHGIGG